MTHGPETTKAQNCGCPEVRLTEEERTALASNYAGEVPRWIPYCQYCEFFTERLGKAPVDSSSPEPVSWRCPKCERSIIRTGVRPEEEEDEEEPEFPWLRVDFRCWSPACDWSNSLLTLPSDGLVAGAV